MSTVGLVTTFRFVPFLPGAGGQEAASTFERCWSTLNSFLLFHLAKGVDHVFLYADANDGSNDVYIGTYRVVASFDSSRVSIDVRDQRQKERQQSCCRLWSQLGSFSAREVPARQSLNAEDALRRAGEMGLDWLLHLDIDELFFTEERSIQPHFERLRELGVEQMTYANHEAVPLGEDVGDYFREVSTFKVNHLLLPLSHEVVERTRFWRRRTGHGQYMLAYDNGKSAVRVLPGRIVPQSVHRWRTLNAGERESSILEPPSQSSGGGVTDAGCRSAERRGGEAEECDSGDGSQAASTPSPSSSEEGGQLVNRVAMADPRELRFDEVLACTDPCVLHYPSCGLGWLRDKYRLLGTFPSSWFGGKLPIAPCFHLDARDAVLEGRGGPAVTAGGNADGAGSERAEGDGVRALYRKEVMLCPEEHSEEMQAQLEHGVLRVIGGPARVIVDALHAQAPGSPDTTASILSEGTCPKSKAGVGGAPLEGGGGGKTTFAAALLVAEGVQPPAAVSAGDAPGAAGGLDESVLLDNAWILAACAREYL
ncbi:unnamed protein product [Hapterophycus canaliculatus]